MKFQDLVEKWPHVKPSATQPLTLECLLARKSKLLVTHSPKDPQNVRLIYQCGSTKAFELGPSVALADVNPETLSPISEWICKLDMPILDRIALCPELRACSIIPANSNVVKICGWLMKRHDMATTTVYVLTDEIPMMVSTRPFRSTLDGANTLGKAGIFTLEQDVVDMQEWMPAGDVAEEKKDIAAPADKTAATPSNDDADMPVDLMSYFTLNPTVNNIDAFLWAAQYGYLDVVEFLVKSGRVDPALQDNLALIEAIQHNHLDIVKFLSSLDAVDVTDNDNRAYRIAANLVGHSGIANFLLSIDGVNRRRQLQIDHEQSLNRRDYYVALDDEKDKEGASAPAAADDITTFPAGLAMYFAMIPGSDNISAFLWAVRYGFLDVVEFLVKSGRVDPTCPALEESCALELAVKTNQLEVVRFLFSLDGMDVTEAFPIAAAFGSLEILKFLLAIDVNGAGPEYNDSVFAAAVQSATINGHSEVVKFLSTHRNIDMQIKIAADEVRQLKNDGADRAAVAAAVDALKGRKMVKETLEEVDAKFLALAVSEIAAMLLDFGMHEFIHISIAPAPICLDATPNYQLNLIVSVDDDGDTEVKVAIQTETRTYSTFRVPYKNDESFRQLLLFLKWIISLSPLEYVVRNSRMVSKSIPSFDWTFPTVAPRKYDAELGTGAWASGMGLAHRIDSWLQAMSRAKRAIVFQEVKDYSGLTYGEVNGMIDDIIGEFPTDLNLDFDPRQNQQIITTPLPLTEKWLGQHILYRHLKSMIVDKLRAGLATEEKCHEVSGEFVVGIDSTLRVHEHDGRITLHHKSLQHYFQVTPDKVVMIFDGNTVSCANCTSFGEILERMMNYIWIAQAELAVRRKPDTRELDDCIIPYKRGCFRIDVSTSYFSFESNHITYTVELSRCKDGFRVLQVRQNSAIVLECLDLSTFGWSLYVYLGSVDPSHHQHLGSVDFLHHHPTQSMPPLNGQEEEEDKSVGEDEREIQTAYELRGAVSMSFTKPKAKQPSSSPPCTAKIAEGFSVPPFLDFDAESGIVTWTKYKFVHVHILSLITQPNQSSIIVDSAVLDIDEATREYMKTHFSIVLTERRIPAFPTLRMYRFHNKHLFACAATTYGWFKDPAMSFVDSLRLDTEMPYSPERVVQLAALHIPMKVVDDDVIKLTGPKTGLLSAVQAVLQQNKDSKSKSTSVFLNTALIDVDAYEPVLLDLGFQVLRSCDAAAYVVDIVN